MRTFQILFAGMLGLLLVAGCDHGLPTDSVSSLQPSLSTPAQPQEGCEHITDVAGTVWTAIPVVGQPGMVLMERDGKPICFDTADSLAARAARLQVRLIVTPLAPAGPSPSVNDKTQTPATLITDDPIPVGGTRVAENTPGK